MQQAGRAEITALFMQVLDRALRLEKNIDWGQFASAIADTLIVPNGKTDLSIANGQIIDQMGQDVADTLVDDGIEDVSQHQPFSSMLEAANALGTIVGDGLVYGGRDVYHTHRENTAVNTIDESALLSNPFGQMMTLPGDNLALTMADIYGPAIQPAPQATKTPQNNTNAINNNSTVQPNTMTQQTLSQSEQAANQAATDAQNQLAQARGVQNGIAANDNASSGWENGLAQYLYANQSNSFDKAVIEFFGGLSKTLTSSTAVSMENVLANTAQLADSLNPVANLVEGITNRDLVTGNYVSTLQADLGITVSMLGMMGGDLLAALPAVGSSIAGNITSSLGRFGLFGGLGNGVQAVLDEGQSLYHTVTSASNAQAVLNGIDPTRFNDASRFGAAFYLSEVPDTTIAELTYHDSIGVDTIRFNFNSSSATILDLTNPEIAKSWGYNGGEAYGISQMIAQNAQQLGFDVIRYSSERGVGSNLAVFSNFENLLTPEMIVPIPDYTPPRTPSFN